MLGGPGGGERRRISSSPSATTALFIRAVLRWSVSRAPFSFLSWLDVDRRDIQRRRTGGARCQMAGVDPTAYMARPPTEAMLQQGTHTSSSPRFRSRCAGPRCALWMCSARRSAAGDSVPVHGAVRLAAYAKRLIFVFLPKKTVLESALPDPVPAVRDSLSHCPPCSNRHATLSIMALAWHQSPLFPVGTRGRT